MKKFETMRQRFDASLKTLTNFFHEASQTEWEWRKKRVNQLLGVRRAAAKKAE